MLRISPVVVAISLACVSAVSADFDKFHFSSNATEYACPGFGLGCIPPMICAHEAITDQYYCCASGAIDAVCWKGSPDCDGGSDKKPSGSQQSCSSGNNAFCCLKTREECTATKNQINICWSTVKNPVANLSDTKLNDTFSSLSSADPSASSFPISLAQLEATPTSSASVSLSTTSFSSTSASATTTATTAAATTTTSSTSTSTAAPNGEDKGLSGGAIGGIVGGVVGGLALIGVIGFILFRRRKASSKGNHAPIASGSPSEHGNPYELNGFQQQHIGMAEAPAPVDKYSHNGGPRPGTFEMQGTEPPEMDGSANVRR